MSPSSTQSHRHRHRRRPQQARLLLPLLLLLLLSPLTFFAHADLTPWDCSTDPSSPSCSSSATPSSGSARSSSVPRSSSSSHSGVALASASTSSTTASSWTTVRSSTGVLNNETVDSRALDASSTDLSSIAIVLVIGGTFIVMLCVVFCCVSLQHHLLARLTHRYRYTPDMRTVLALRKKMQAIPTFDDGHRRGDPSGGVAAALAPAVDMGMVPAVVETGRSFASTPAHGVAEIRIPIDDAQESVPTSSPVLVAPMSDAPALPSPRWVAPPQAQYTPGRALLAPTPTASSPLTLPLATATTTTTPLPLLQQQQQQLQQQQQQHLLDFRTALALAMSLHSSAATANANDPSIAILAAHTLYATYGPAALQLFQQAVASPPVAASSPPVVAIQGDQ